MTMDGVKLIKASAGTKMRISPPQCPYRTISDDWNTIYFCQGEAKHKGLHEAFFGKPSKKTLWFLPKDAPQVGTQEADMAEKGK